MRKVKKHSKQHCEYCKSDQYVRDCTKGKKIPFNALKALQHRRNQVSKMGAHLEAAKFKLVFEHNIVEALKKYVPSKKDFADALALAKKETISKKKVLYNKLVKNKIIKEESNIGFKF